MTKIFFYRKAFIGTVLLGSVLLFWGGHEDSSTTYKTVFLMIGFLFLVSSLMAIKLPALKIENSIIYYRHFFGLNYRRIEVSKLQFYERAGTSVIGLYNLEGNPVAKIGFLNPKDIEEILVDLSLTRKNEQMHK